MVDRIRPRSRHPVLTRRGLLLGGSGAAGALVLDGCWALLIKGTPKNNPRSNEIMWGFVLLDLLVMGSITVTAGGAVLLFLPIGLIIDFATRAIYRPISEGGEIRRRKREKDLDDIEEEMEEEGRDARWSPAGNEAVEVALCPEADALLVEQDAARLSRWARRFRDHLELCPHCAAGLLAPGPVAPMPDHLVGAGTAVTGDLELSFPGAPDLDPDAVAGLADSTEALLDALGRPA